MFEIITLSQTNCYLFRTKAGYLLIDCGNQHDEYKFVSILKHLGVKLSDISYLVLTHHHSDHCGLLNFIVSKAPQVKVVMSSVCAGFMQSGSNHKHKNERFSNPSLHFIFGIYSKLSKNCQESFPPYFLRKSDLIIEQDDYSLLPGLGIQGKILLTPGHTEDSLSVIVEDTAFVGDAARNILNFTGTPYQPIILYNYDACLSSWNKLIASGAKTIYPAHGKAFCIKKLINRCFLTAQYLI